MVMATMAVIMFGGMHRYDNASGLMWRNIRFEADGSAFEITFDTRKNSQFRQGNKVLVSVFPLAIVCPVRLLQRLRLYTGGAEGLYVVRGINGKLVSKSPGNTALGPKQITYDQLLRYLSSVGLWAFPWRLSESSLSRSPGGAEALPPRQMRTSRRNFGRSIETGSLERRKSATWRATRHIFCRCRGRLWALRKARRRMCGSSASPRSSRR